MATEEARAMLDALMGGDRNAALPPGAAVPGNYNNNNNNNKRTHGGANGALLLPGKRQKSCFDRDIDPLYTAWGVDVYELFVNTKSDLGTNPYVVDRGAHEEFQNLSKEEQERTGYYYFLFQKLQELVRQCDRIVHRNKEKLQQELQRKLSQRGGQDFVEDVDDAAVESLVRAMWQVHDLTVQYNETVGQLDDIVVQEEDAKRKLEPLLLEQQAWVQQKSSEQEGGIKQEEEEEANGEVKVKEEGTITEESADNAATTAESSSQPSSDSKPVKKEEDTETAAKTGGDLETLQLELGKLTLQKQRLVFELGRIMSRLVPLQESVESQHRNLNYVKSDISTDKTVCEVSGNFMSSRDADERIAAHYAGKQYVGWRLVRNKYQEMIQRYGRYGPPPPGRDASGPPPPPAAPPMSHHRGGGGGGGGGYGRRGGGDGYRDRGRYDSGYSHGGDRGGRWERQGPGGGGGYQDRGRPSPPPRGGGGWRR